MRRPRRPGYLRNLGDSWTDMQAEAALAAKNTNALEDQATNYIDTRSGAANTGAMRGIRRPERMSSPEFLLKNAAWYREYMRKVMQNSND